MRHWFPMILCSLSVGLCLSCSQTDEQTSYPSLITDFAELYTDTYGNLYQIQPDRQPAYYIDSPIAGYLPSTEYRGVCTYTFSSLDSTAVHLYGLERVSLLQDSTRSAYPGTDPLQAVSLWDGGNFINLHLSVKTQNGTHYLGYRLDSIRIAPNRQRTVYMTLYHNQNNDPLSYSQKVYASLSKSSLNAIIQEGDSICIYIHTFEGLKHWNFIY